MKITQVIAGSFVALFLSFNIVSADSQRPPEQMPPRINDERFIFVQLPKEVCFGGACEGGIPGKDILKRLYSLKPFFETKPGLYMNVSVTVNPGSTYTIVEWGAETVIIKDSGLDFSYRKFTPVGCFILSVVPSKTYQRLDIVRTLNVRTEQDTCAAVSVRLEKTINEFLLNLLLE